MTPRRLGNTEHTELPQSYNAHRQFQKCNSKQRAWSREGTC